MSNYEIKVKDKYYIDISLAFTPSPMTNDITLLTNERAINNSLKNIIMTLPNEVAFFRNFGSRTNEFLFNFITESNSLMLANEIERAILFCEPRITFDPMGNSKSTISPDHVSARNKTQVSLYDDDLGVDVNASPDQNGYEVTIKYRISGLERVYKVSEILTPTR